MIFQEIGGTLINNRWIRLNESYRDHGSPWRVVRMWAIYDDSHQFHKTYLTRVQYGKAITEIISEPEQVD